jgi:YVTN family beta-propeller protein
VIDCALNQTRAILTMPGIPWNLCYDPHTDAVYSANRSANTVTVIDGVGDSVTRSLPTFILSQCIAFNPIQNRVYVGSAAGWRMIVIQDSGDAAIAENRTSNPRRPPTFPTIVRSVVQVDSRQHAAYSAELLDVSGRKVLALHPGANDVSSLMPGVHFIFERWADGGPRSAMSKIVIQR